MEVVEEVVVEVEEAVAARHLVREALDVDRVREQIAEEEDKRIEARISKEVKKQALNQVTK